MRTTREMVNDESHYLWGKRYLLEIIDGNVKDVGTKGKRLKITAPANSSRDELSKVLYDLISFRSYGKRPHRY